MSKKKHKQHPKQAAQAEHKGAPGNKHDNITLAFRHAFSNGWVQNSGVAFLLAIVGLVIAMATRSQVKTAAIGVASIGTLALWIFAAAVMHSVEESSVVITKKVLFLGLTGDIGTSGPFWIKYKSPAGDTLSPLPVAMYVVLHNNQTIPLKVPSLRVSMQAKGSDWLQLTPVESQSGQVFWVGDNAKQARPLDSRNPMLDALLRNPIPAGTPLEG